MKHMIMAGIFSIHALFVSGQDPFKNIKNERVKATVADMYRYMKSHDFDTSIIARFFNKSEMLDRLGSQKIANVEMQYQILSGIDRVVDIIPADSLFFKEVPDAVNKYVAGFIINDTSYPVLDIAVDGSGKLIYMLPFLYFDQEEGKQIQQFIDRHTSSKNK